MVSTVRGAFSFMGGLPLGGLDLVATLQHLQHFIEVVEVEADVLVHWRPPSFQMMEYWRYPLERLTV